MQFLITESAAYKIIELANLESISPILRVGVDGGGCSGFQYKFSISNTFDNEDLLLEKNGAKVAIDKLSQGFLDNCTLDYFEDLGGAGFFIYNPNAKAKCGCGNSFAID